MSFAPKKFHDLDVGGAGSETEGERAFRKLEEATERNIAHIDDRLGVPWYSPPEKEGENAKAYSMIYALNGADLIKETKRNAAIGKLHKQTAELHEQLAATGIVPTLESATKLNEEIGQTVEALKTERAKHTIAVGKENASVEAGKVHADQGESKSL